MKRTPIAEFYRFPITAGIALLAVFVTVLGKTGHSIERLVMSVQAFEGEPYRLVTCVLPHADAMHLIFNVLWLWVFGTVLEERFGPIRLLGWILLFAVGSSAAEYAIFSGGIGLSGVVYGLFGLLWVASRADDRLQGTLDGQTSLLFVIWFFLCIVTTAMHIWPVANVAHGVGWLLGLLVGLAITGGLRPGSARMSIRVVSIVGIVLVTAASLAGATNFRARVNFAENGGLDQALLASQAFDEGHYDVAIDRYRAAIAISPKVASNWYNLGVAYSRKGDYNEASQAFIRASELSSEADIKRATLNTLRYLAYTAQIKREYADAVRLYEDVLARGGEDAPTLYNLAVAYQSIGRADDSRRMLTRAVKLDPTLAEDVADEPSFAAPDAGVDGAVH